MIALAGPVAAADEPAAHDIHWGYGEHDGPAVWGKLSPRFAQCARGRAQTPIDLDPAMGKTVPAPGATLHISPRRRAVGIVNNGHTIQVSDEAGSVLQVGAVTYRLVQFHFHTPSEHTVGGRRFAMEMHLVHRSENGELAVVGILMEEGAASAALAPLWAHLPQAPGPERPLDASVDVASLLPVQRRAYRYDGSLTTPPCTEGVRWFVFAQPITISTEQVGAFRAVMRDDSRPVQALNGRPVAVTEVGVQ